MVPLLRGLLWVAGELRWPSGAAGEPQASANATGRIFLRLSIFMLGKMILQIGFYGEARLQLYPALIRNLNNLAVVTSDCPEGTGRIHDEPASAASVGARSIH